MAAGIAFVLVLLCGSVGGPRSDACIEYPSLLESRNAMTQLHTYERQQLRSPRKDDQACSEVRFAVNRSTSYDLLAAREPSLRCDIENVVVDDTFIVVFGILIWLSFILVLKKEPKKSQHPISEKEVLTIQHRVLAQFAHEVRNKVTAPATFLEQVDQLVSSATKPEHLFSELKTMRDDIACSVVLLREADQLVQTRLALHALTTGNYRSSRHTFDILELLRGQTTALRIRDELSPVCLNCIVPPEYENCSVSLDSLVFDHVARNLLGNATKFTRSGSIELRFLGHTTPSHAEKKEDLLTFSVKDTGLGIPQQVVERLFVEDVISCRERGVGLGLISCRQFLNVIRGDIWLEKTKRRLDDNNEGGGTEFRFVVPGRLIAPPPTHLADDDVSATPTNIPASATVVVVDDSRVIRQALIKKLKSVAKSRSWAFVEHSTVESVLPTIETLKAHREDVIVTVDENLDSQGGYLKGRDLIRALVEAEFKGVIVSASGDENVGNQHVQLGAHLQLNKPFPTSEKISSLLETAFGSSPSPSY